MATKIAMETCLGPFENQQTWDFHYSVAVQLFNLTVSSSVMDYCQSIHPGHGARFHLLTSDNDTTSNDRDNTLTMTITKETNGSWNFTNKINKDGSLPLKEFYITSSTNEVNLEIDAEYNSISGQNTSGGAFIEKTNIALNNHVHGNFSDHDYSASTADECIADISTESEDHLSKENRLEKRDTHHNEDEARYQSKPEKDISYDEFLNLADICSKFLHDKSDDALQYEADGAMVEQSNDGKHVSHSDNKSIMPRKSARLSFRKERIKQQRMNTNKGSKRSRSDSSRNTSPEQNPKRNKTLKAKTLKENNRKKSNCVHVQEIDEDKIVDIIPSVDTDQLKCPFCSYTCMSTDQSCLKLHVEEFHKLEPSSNEAISDTLNVNTYDTPESDTGTVTHTEKINEDGSSKFKCTECDKVFHQDKLYKKHLQNDHLHLSSLKFDKESPNHLTCYICDQSFSSQAKLKKHNKSEHLAEVKKEDKQKPTIICSLCPAKFTQHWNLYVHMNKHHRHHVDFLQAIEDIKPFLKSLCGQCGKFFNTPRYLKEHELKEHDAMHSKPVPCPHCGKVFRSTFHMKAHIRHIHREDPRSILCEYCPAKFTHRSVLYSHIQLVHVKPNRDKKCDLCNFKYALKSQLKDHKRSVHNPKKHECPKCGYCCATSWYIRKHMALCKGQARKIKNKQFMQLPADDSSDITDSGRQIVEAAAIKLESFDETKQAPVSAEYCDPSSQSRSDNYDAAEIENLTDTAKIAYSMLGIPDGVTEEHIQLIIVQDQSGSQDISNIAQHIQHINMIDNMANFTEHIQEINSDEVQNIMQHINTQQVEQVTEYV